MSVCLTTTAKLGTVDLDHYWVENERHISIWSGPEEIDRLIIALAYGQETIWGLVELNDSTRQILHDHNLKFAHYETETDPYDEMIFGDQETGSLQLTYNRNGTWDVSGPLAAFNSTYRDANRDRFRDIELAK